MQNYIYICVGVTAQCLKLKVPKILKVPYQYGLLYFASLYPQIVLNIFSCLELKVNDFLPNIMDKRRVMEVTLGVLGNEGTLNTQ